MKSLKVGLLLMSLWFCACTDRDSVPSGIIGQDSMQMIMKDVIAADHFASEYVLKDSLRKDSVHRDVKLETRRLYETVFKIHHITRDEFKTSLQFYYSRPDLLKKMFDSLSAYETRHRNELYKPRYTPGPHGRDSLKLNGRPVRKDSLPGAARPLPKDSILGIDRPAPRNLVRPPAHPVHPDSVKKVVHH